MNNYLKTTWEGELRYSLGLTTLLSLLLLLTFSYSYGQYDGNAIATYEQSFNYPKMAVKQRTVVEKCILSESIVKYSKTIHSVIDGRQKLNHCVTWVKNPLSSILWTNLQNGNLTGYRTEEMDEASAYYDLKVMHKTVVGYEVYDTINTLLSTFSDPVTDPGEFLRPFYPEEFVKFRIKEEWIFDYERSVMEPRITAVALVGKPWLAGGIQDEKEYPLVWISMEQLRPLFINSELFNRDNGAARLTYDDFFQLRLFDSYVVKQSNEWEQDINQFPEFKDNGVDALVESFRIKNDLFIFEHDLWEF